MTLFGIWTNIYLAVKSECNSPGSASSFGARSMEENKLTSISEADSLERVGEFGDTHDFTDFDDLNAADVHFEISCAVPIEEELFS